MKKRSPAVFLDRDGTLIDERGYFSDPQKKMHFYPGVFKALRLLRQQGYKLVVVSNQSGVARGFFSLATLKKINRRFQALLARGGVRIDGLYSCPHLPNAGCVCRKPRPALAQRAARALRLDLKKSYVIGDQLTDIQMAKNIGAKGVLVLTGAGLLSRKKAAGRAAKVARNLVFAGRWIRDQKEGS